MDRARRRQIEELFEAALERAPAERETFLERACAGDAGLRDEVGALLEAHHLAERVFDDAPRPPPAGVPDARIGPYRVVREIGRGGMGTVYLAERADGQYRRRVAIKLIASTSADDPLHQRFLAERQILAGLDHPHIARLLDGGVTDDGRPYLVLEYVDGMAITAYCDRHRLGVEARLRLFLDVCAAVQHAHQNLVIHRDLKPGNILVTPAGQVRLLDFGIAKLLNPALSAADAPVTRLDLRVMTPEYASPEQVRGDAITTASDVYALGVLLYELLTGSPPYRLGTHSPAEVLAAVCERDPERPSTRITRADHLPRAVAAEQELTPARRGHDRGTSPERLRRRLQGDLDSIVMRALRKEPGRRYASADQLRQDLERYLEGRPVLAHRGSRRYRLGKLVRRHRAGAAATALVLASLLGGLGTALWQARVANVERDRADAARAEAVHALAQSRSVTDFLMQLFEAGETQAGAAGADVSARELLRRGSARAARLADEPAVHARLLDVIGQMHYRLGQYDDAARLLEQAVAIRRTLQGPAAVDLAESLIHLARVHRSRAERGEARRLVAEALELRRRLLPAGHPDVAVAYHELGWLAAGREQEALYREALGVLQHSDARPEYQVRLLHGIATNLRRQGRAAEALETDREALRLAERRLGPEHFRTGYAMIHLADHVRDTQRDYPAAERLYRRGLELMTRHHGEQSTELIHGLHALGTLQSLRGNHPEAERLFRRSLAIRAAATGPEHPDVAGELFALARALQRQGRLDEAETMMREAVDHWTRRLGPRHPRLAGALADLAELLDARGRHPEAGPLFERALEILAGAGLAEGAQAGELHHRYGRALLRQRRFEPAEHQLLRAVAVLEHAHESPDHPTIQQAEHALAELYAAWGRPHLAARYRPATPSP